MNSQFEFMILEKVKAHCEHILTTTKCKELPFHNVEHTRQVVQNATTITQQLGLSDEKIEPVLIAAWFHDTGFCDAYEGHEDVSIGLAESFLKKHGYPAEKVEIVISCIEATKMPQDPSNEFAEVLSDADIFHISTPDFFYRKLLLRREWELELGKKSTDLEWHELNLDFLQNHQFFTEYGKKVLMEGQEENEAKVMNLIGLYNVYRPEKS